MQVKHISAAAGQPSTFWSKDGTLWYKTKGQANVNNPLRAVKPEEYKRKKTFWQANKWTIIVIVAVIGCVLSVYTAYKFKKELFPKIPNNILQ